MSLTLNHVVVAQFQRRHSKLVIDLATFDLDILAIMRTLTVSNRDDVVHDGNCTRIIVVFAMPLDNAIKLMSPWNQKLVDDVLYSFNVMIETFTAVVNYTFAIV